MDPIIEVKYVPGLRTESTHLRSGVTIFTDAPLDNNGKGESFSPTDLACSSLASCMMTIMGILAEREGIHLDGLRASVIKVMGANPRRISGIKIHLSHPGLVATDEQKEKLRRAALTCPVALSLGEGVSQEITFGF